MKYLQNRNQFINRKIVLESSQINKQIQNSRLIRETFENDITWGGSLLGRLINSIIRRVGIYAGTARIPFLVSSVKSELEKLMWDVTTTPEQKTKGTTITLRFILEKIHNVVKDENLTTAQKCTKLIGDKDSDAGLLNEVLRSLEKISTGDFPSKEELVDKLNRFKENIEKIDFEPENIEEEIDEIVQTFSQLELDFVNVGDEFINLFTQISKQLEDYKKFKTKKEQQEKNKSNSVDSDQTVEKSTDKAEEEEKTGSTIFTNKESGKEIVKENYSLSFYYQNECLPIFENLKPNEIKKGETYLWNGNKVKVLSTTHSMKREGDKLIEDTPLTSGGMTVCVIGEGENAQIKTVQISFLKTLSSEQSEDKGDSLITNAMEKLLNKQQNLKNTQDTEVNLKEYNTEEKIEFYIKLSEGINKTKSFGYPQLIKEKLEDEDETIRDILEIYTLLMAFYEDEGMKLIESMKDSEEDSVSNIGKILLQIKNNLDGEEGLKKISSEVIEKRKKKSQSQGQDQGQGQGKEEKENQNRRIIFDFKKFKMFEEAGDEAVENAYDEIFDRNEHEQWKVRESEAKELQEATSKPENEIYPIEEESCRDHIIRIVNIFGKAYRNYATMHIPSGRPEGRISLATFREYQYIGDDDSPPDWEADSNPGRGPWAAILPYRQWQDGIMGILEDTKYRKILANARFLPKGVEKLGSGETGQGKSGADGYPQKIVRSGRSLFDFINDLISGEGEFDKIKRKILAEYFKGADEIDDKTKIELRESSIETNKETWKDENSLAFLPWGNTAGLARTDISGFKIKEFEAKNGKYKSEIIKLPYKSSDGNEKNIIGHVMGIKSFAKKYFVIIKFNITKKDSSQTSFISNYFADQIKDGDFKLDDTVAQSSKPLNFYLGVMPFSSESDKFKIRNPIQINYAKITGQNKIDDSDVLTIQIKPTDILSLGYKNSSAEYLAAKCETYSKPNSVGDFKSLGDISDTILKNLDKVISK